MSGPKTSENVIVLRCTPSGESFLKLECLGQESGMTIYLKRIPKKTAGQARPDLFDSAVLELENGRNGNGIRFVSDYQAIKQRTTIGQNYDRLKRASEFSQILLRNAGHLPDTFTVFKLAEQTFDAFNGQGNSQVVLFKGLFLLLREEGFPVRESWWPQLPKEHRETARKALNQPVPVAADAAFIEQSEQVYLNLCRWLRRETDLILPQSQS